MEIKRDRYLNKIISFMWDGQVKVITGIRRCGKSYLLRNLFRDYLLGQRVPENHILSFELDLARDIRFRNPLELAKAVREIVEGKDEQFYLFVDEIQMSDEVPNPYNACLLYTSPCHRRNDSLLFITSCRYHFCFILGFDLLHIGGQSILRNMDIVVFFFFEGGYPALAFNQHCKRGSLNTPNDQPLMIERGEKPCSIDADNPVSL